MTDPHRNTPEQAAILALLDRIEALEREVRMLTGVTVAQLGQSTDPRAAMARVRLLNTVPLPADEARQ